MKLARPFVRLPFNFDAERLAGEIRALPDSAWMPHPSGLRGNSAVALISRDGADNDDFIGAMQTTPHLERCAYHRQVMACFDEVLARSRLMKLAAGCEVTSHVDFNYHWYTRVRVHVPVFTNPEVTFYCGDESLHMGAGECWVFDNWRWHNVVNNGRDDRVHLVIDMAGSSRFWNTVRHMQSLDAAEVDRITENVPFDPEKRVELVTETYSISPVMAPGEIDGLVNDLIRDFESHPANDPELVDQYRILLTDFARDWRAIWLRHGMQQSGIPHYRQLIDRVTGRLHPDRRALVASSNDIGVNAIIMQRILRPSLAVEVYDRFFNGGRD
jgi:hypothetical protein